MSARGAIAAHFTSDTLANQLIDALVAEVRREDADYIVAIQQRVEADEIAEHGSLDHESELQGQAVRTMAAHLRAEARKKDTRDFFQPGHTYTHGDYRFRCAYLVTHPTHGHRAAWGWFGKQGTGWRHASFSERQYAIRAWTDTTNDTTTGDPA